MNIFNQIFIRFADPFFEQCGHTVHSLFVLLVHIALCPVVRGMQAIRTIPHFFRVAIFFVLSMLEITPTTMETDYFKQFLFNNFSDI